MFLSSGFNRESDFSAKAERDIYFNEIVSCLLEAGSIEEAISVVGSHYGSKTERTNRAIYLTCVIGTRMRIFLDLIGIDDRFPPDIPVPLRLKYQIEHGVILQELENTDTGKGLLEDYGTSGVRDLFFLQPFLEMDGDNIINPILSFDTDGYNLSNTDDGYIPDWRIQAEIDRSREVVETFRDQGLSGVLMLPFNESYLVDN